MIAAELAAAGKKVLVLEMGGYRNEQDFKQLELPGYQELYYGAGLAASENGSIGILAGQTLGGGTVVNYMNCIPTPEHIVAEWSEHGLVGLDDDEAYRREHIGTVMERINANTEATTQNGTHTRLMAGLDALGHEHRPIVRNAALDDNPQNCGYCPAGCQHGCKRSAMKTWLQDASDSGASALVDAHAERILVEDGRATGVAATVTHADGSTTAVTVEAPTVVVACGSVESPALLLRSGIGGPAVGKNLRLHPAYMVVGTYDEPVEGWRGQIQSLVSDAYADLEDGCGFLIEATGMFPGLVGASMPWESGADHKRLMQALPWHAPFISVARDHGSGEVVLDDHGRAVGALGARRPGRPPPRQARQRRALPDPAGGRARRRSSPSTAASCAGGRARTSTPSSPRSRRRPMSPTTSACFSAHQMGSCRMGSDPETSVADGRGELHDTKGVWIGDGSAFPSAPGVNPMVSIMSLAHRTADQMLVRAPSRAAPYWTASCPPNRRIPILIAAFGALAVLLSGCVGIKPGTYTLTQPGGIGSVSMRFTVCTLMVTAPPPGSEIPAVVCGPVNEPGQGQMLVTLMVPVGQRHTDDLQRGSRAGGGRDDLHPQPRTHRADERDRIHYGHGRPPPASNSPATLREITESGTQELTWTIETGIGLPRGPAAAPTAVR